jgi:methylase of polypeptide subunit release factors
LFAGDDGLDLIRDLVSDLPRILSAAGHAVLEHGWTQGPAIRALGEAVGLQTNTIQDLAGKDRFAHLTRVR